MEKAQVLAGIEKLKPWFHKIDFPEHRVSTKQGSDFGEDADHPLPTWRHVRKCFPDDLSGKTVLDIGCNGGFYSFEARKRNAEAVLGVDARNQHVRQARFAQTVLGLDRMEFRRQSLYELDPLRDGQWDMVLALGLVYHLKHLVAGLESLFRMTRETLVLESAVALPGMAAASPFKRGLSTETAKVLQPVTMEYGGVEKEFMPLFYVKNDEYAMEAAENWFLPTTETLVGMLRDVGFPEVECVDTFGGRTLIRARKAGVITDSTRPNWLRAEFQVDNLRPRYAPGETVSLTIHVENREISTWLCQGVDARGKGQVNLSPTLTSAADPLFYAEPSRVSLPRDIAPGERCELNLSFQAPATPGAYALELDMVAEHVCFFQDQGSSPLTLTLNVT